MSNSMHIDLQPLALAHAAQLSLHANNPEISRHNRDSFPYPYTLRSAIAFVDVARMQEEKHFAVHRAIIADGVACGVVGVTMQPDIFRCGAELGYWVGQQYWNKGVATQAVRLLSKMVFADYPAIHRIYAEVLETNPASLKVLQKAGYTHEAVLHKRFVKDDTIYNGHVYALLRA